MKKINLSLSILSFGILSLLMSSCENQNVDFPNFDYSAVYFAYQYPVRTIVLGEDVYDTSLDNDHKCKIYATMGGVYENKKKITIDFVADNTLCNNLYFANGSPVAAMPANYYQLSGNQIFLDKELTGAVEVQLSDQFFADKKSLSNTYVIPLQMTKVTNADSILSGKALVENPIKTKADNWDVKPKDYVLYCVKFINRWHAYYLRRGIDVITKDGSSTSNVRHKEFVEKDEVVKMTSASLASVEYPVTVVNASGVNETCTLLLTFSNDNKCTVSALTSGFTASGTGAFVEKGEKKSWGDKDRDAIYLDYKINLTAKSYATKDTLVVRDRGISMETFSPTYKNQ